MFTVPNKYKIEKEQGGLDAIFGDMKSIVILVWFLLSGCQTAEKNIPSEDIHPVIDHLNCKISPKVTNKAIKIMMAGTCKDIIWTLPAYNQLGLPELRWTTQYMPSINYDPSKAVSVIDNVKDRVESLRKYDNWKGMSVILFENNGIKLTYQPLEK